MEPGWLLAARGSRASPAIIAPAPAPNFMKPRRPMLEFRTAGFGLFMTLLLRTESSAVQARADYTKSSRSAPGNAACDEAQFAVYCLIILGLALTFLREEPERHVLSIRLHRAGDRI